MALRPSYLKQRIFKYTAVAMELRIRNNERGFRPALERISPFNL